ncbi:MAG: hypothetical protein M0D53_08720 [Flavobacterium sp. JAD_PAG50586_2]|nr:MAG: hypothetical protein M0D53_08720 [Flavobacterium sp. JAD_PAG50586_2]
MKKLFFFLILGSMLSFENESYSDLITVDSTINLKWNKAYADDTIDKSIIGLKWALSYMGAVLPSSANGFSTDTNIITIDLQKLGFNENAQRELLKLSKKIKATSEYKVNNNIDLGQFVTLLLGSSEHYYQIIGTPKKLNEILSRYTLSPKKATSTNRLFR